MPETLFFSILIPTYNRPERLSTCLQAIAKLDYPRDRFEVIVADDGSDRPLDTTVAPFYDRFDLKLVRQENAGPAAARNFAAGLARGEYLAFTDDDCMPTADWLKQLAAQFAKAPDCLLGGKTLNALPDNLYSSVSQALIDYLYNYYNAGSGKISFFASNNIALPAERFRALGGFDTSFPLAAAEDREFCDRWLDKGYQMLYVPEAQVLHAHHLTLSSFWRQHFCYGRGAFCFHQVRSQRAAEPIKVEPLSFYFNLLAYPFSKSSRQPEQLVPLRERPKLSFLEILLAWLVDFCRNALVSLMFFVSQLATTVGFFWERASKTPPRTA